MAIGNVLVNDTVRIKVKFIDTDPNTGEQVDISPVLVTVTVYNSDDEVVTTSTATAVSGSTSDYYYDFTPTLIGEYKITFVGSFADSTYITVNQSLYVSSQTVEYKPTVTLSADEIISFGADIEPLYLDPEAVQVIFPDATKLEIAELIHNISHEINSIFGITASTTDPMSVIEGYGSSTYAVAEYIRASACCQLTRIYGFGGDDELSVQLADLQITNRNTPRSNITRSNATTWCQVAAALRKEILTKRVGIRGVQPKGLPQRVVTPSGASLDPQTGALIYINDTNVYGPRDMFRPGVKTQADPTDPMPDRGIKRYD
jgi:hypothetical protein